MMQAQKWTFYDTLQVLDIVSRTKEGMTKGQIQKYTPGLTLGQVGRMLESLLTCGFIFGEVRPYARTGKTVYQMTENASIMLASIARQHTETYQG